MPISIIFKTTKGSSKYDLTDEKNFPKIKASVTRKINDKNKAELEDLRKQLGKAYKGKKLTEKQKTFILQQDARIKIVLDEIKEVPDIIASLNGTTYNLKEKSRQKALKDQIKTYTKREDGLTHLQSLEKELIDAGKDAKNKEYKQPIEAILKLVKKGIDAKEKEVAYTPYTDLLQEEFLPESTKTNAFHNSTEQDAAITKYSQDDTMEAYLQKSVTTKKATGEKAYREISACFAFDYKHLDKLQHVDISAQLFSYLFAIQHLFMHNASYFPAQGHGKAPKRELEKQQQYYRNEAGHPEIFEISKQGFYGIPNTPYKNFLLQILEKDKTDELFTALQELSDDGKYGQKKPPDYFGPTLGHLGMRSNNVTNKTKWLKKTRDKITKEKIKAFLETAQEHSPVDNKIRLGYMASGKILIEDSIKKIKERFRELDTDTHHQNLQEKSMKARQRLADDIVRDTGGLKQITLEHPSLSNLLYINLYPFAHFETSMGKENAKALTNLFIGFFTGLLNYHFQKAGLDLCLQKRQSFGFLSSTITDAGPMRIRLSLGLEAPEFKIHLQQALQEFDKLITKYDFSNPRKIGVNFLVKNTLQATEQPLGKKETLKTGNYAHAAMRTEDDQWAAILVTQKYLAAAEKIDDSDYISEAFKDYLENFVINRSKHKQLHEEQDHHKIMRSAYTFKRIHADIHTAAQSAEAPEIICGKLISENVILQILQNTLSQAAKMITELDDLPASYSLYHLLLKLLHNCEKGHAILNNLHRYNLAHWYAKSQLIIENIMEYMIPLKQLAKKTVDPKDLEAFEKNRHATQLKLSVDDLEIFYQDSGQQANNLAAMMLLKQHELKPSEASIFLFPETYYEFSKFCAHIKLSTEPDGKENADLWICDITQIESLERSVRKIKAKNKPKGVIIDTTHNSSSQAMEQIQLTVESLREKGVWVMLCCSSLKHEELGLDKYQSGRTTVIAPKGETLREELKETYSAISERAMPQMIATFRDTVESIFNNPPPMPESVAKPSQSGLFSRRTLPSETKEAPKKRKAPAIKAPG